MTGLNSHYENCLRRNFQDFHRAILFHSISMFIPYWSRYMSRVLIMIKDNILSPNSSHLSWQLSNGGASSPWLIRLFFFAKTCNLLLFFFLPLWIALVNRFEIFDLRSRKIQVVLPYIRWHRSKNSPFIRWTWDGQNCYTASCSCHSTKNVLGNGSTLRNVIRIKTEIKQPTMQYFKLSDAYKRRCSVWYSAAWTAWTSRCSTECKNSSEVPCLTLTRI